MKKMGANGRLFDCSLPEYPNTPLSLLLSVLVFVRVCAGTSVGLCRIKMCRKYQRKKAFVEVVIW